MSFFVEMLIQLLSAALGIRIHRPNFTFSLLRKLSGIGIRIQTSEIRNPDEMIRIQIPECVSGSEKVNFGQAIRILEVAIRIHISESFLNSEKVKICWAIRIPKGAIRIPYVNAANKSRICTPIKKYIFLHDPDVFWIWIFLKKMKIRSKYF